MKNEIKRIFSQHSYLCGRHKRNPTDIRCIAKKIENYIEQNCAACGFHVTGRFQNLIDNYVIIDKINH